jgi:hypothetical protein
VPYETGFPGIHDENTVADSSVPRKQDSAVNRDYDVIALSPGVPLRGIVVFHGRIRPRRATSFLPEEEGIQALNGVVDPCDMAITSENKEFIRFVIASHANFSFQVEGATPRVERGDLFEVTLPISYNGSDRGIQGTIPVNKKIKGKNPLVSLSDALACQSLQETFAEEDAIFLGAGEIKALSDDEILECAAKYDASDKIPYKSQNSPIIGKLHTSFQPHVKCFIFKCYEDGIKIKMTSAYRDIEKQTKMLADWLATAEEDEASGIPRGPKPATPGSSYHNYGLAFDFNAWTKSGAHFSTSTSKASWEASGIPTIGKSLGLRWGGDFSNNYDPIHFDAGGISGMPRTNVLYGKAKVQKVAGNQVVIA